MPGFLGFGRLAGMEKTLSSQATNWREGRRLRAWELHQKGWKQRDIAEARGVTQGAVSQWLKRGRDGGVESLRHQPPPEAMPRLSSELREQLLELLPKEPQPWVSRAMCGPNLE